MTSFIGGSLIGSYFILARLADLSSFGNSFTNYRYCHQFSRHFRNGNIDAADKVIVRATTISACVSLSTVILLVLAGYWFLDLIQDGLGRYYHVLIILAAGQAINGFFGPRGAFVSTQFPGKTLRIKLVVQTLGISAMVPAVYFGGLVGAAAASSLIVVSMNAFCARALGHIMREARKSREMEGHE